jgi:hypothetical protein
MSRKSKVLTYPEPLGPPWPVVGDLYLYLYLKIGLGIDFQTVHTLQTFISAKNNY